MKEFSFIFYEGYTDCFCRVIWYYNNDGTITLYLYNTYTKTGEKRTYKTLAAAKAAETKFIKRMNAIYN